MHWFAVVLVPALLAGCRGEPSITTRPGDASTAAGNATALPPTVSRPRLSTATLHKPPEIPPRFVDVAREHGIDMLYFNDFVAGRFFLPEVMGGGAGWLDYDLDGHFDLYVMNGCRLKNPDRKQTEHVNRLFRNRGDGTFQDITFAAGAGDNGYGQGCAVGDFNADGFPDVYLTNYGTNALMRNNGDGSFQDVTETAGVGDSLWGTSSVWLDVDGDDDLDLYVTNYLDITFATHKICEFNGKKRYCGPGSFDAMPDRVFLNQADGTFIESAEELGFVAENGKGLAVVAADFDDDRKPEVYVGNDMTANPLFTRTTDARVEPAADRLYRNVSNVAGCALSRTGKNEASMGIVCADFDRDGRVDIFVTHYFQMKNTLYRNLGNLLFDDDSRRTRIAATSFETLGFGTAALDYDQDGAMDLFVANGHVLGPGHEPNEMKPQLLRNDGGGRFDDITQFAGPYFHDFWLGRGVATADYDNDGDVDLAVTHLNRPLALLRNDTVTGRHFLGLSLATPNRIPPVGGRVVVVAGDQRFTAPVLAGGSYLSCCDNRLLFGLGDWSGPVRVEVFWPSGRDDHFDIPVDRYWYLMEGQRPTPLPISRNP